MSKTSTPSRQPSGGRPVNGSLEQRLDNILEAATQVFLAEGYSSATMGQIARKAGVAKRTIYQHFGGKEQLFEAAIHRLSNAVLSEVPSLEGKTSDSLEQVLTQFACQLLTVVLTPEAIGLERLVISEASRFPELATQFYNNTPMLAMSSLASYLAVQAERGTIQLSHPTISTEHFINMVLGHYYPRVLLNIEAAPSPEQIECHVSTTVQLFLRTCCSQST